MWGTTRISEWKLLGKILFQSETFLLTTVESEEWASLGGSELHTEGLNLLGVEVGCHPGTE